MNKREFIRHLAVLGLSTTAIRSMADQFEMVNHTSMETSTINDDFWTGIRGDYLLKDAYINLENGYYSVMPQSVLKAYQKLTENMNFQGSWYMRREWSADMLEARKQLATRWGCDLEELVITRNTTESLDLVIGGQSWNAGDEAIMAHQDYGAMLNMFRLMEKRFGVVNRLIHLPNHPESDEEIVNLYEGQINSNTKLIMVCHMVNITGQVLPVKKICDMARERGVKVMVDGAHSFAHIPTHLHDLGCDYYGTSLHKWLSAPLGNGLLYVKKESIPTLWPLMAEDELPEGDIKRLNHMGTTPPQNILGIQLAIAFHEMIGAERKEARLRYLNSYWTSRVRGLKNVILNTPDDPNRYCAIANVGLKNMEPETFAETLLEKYRIWTVAINRPGVQGVRITPGIFTTTAELDQLVEAIVEISGNG